MSEDVYIRLREFMDKAPGGYPKTPNGVEIKLLKKLFTEDEAEFVMNLKYEPEEASVIAGRVGIGESEAIKKLDELASKGNIFTVRDGNVKKYQAFQFAPGIYEFHLGQLDRELVDLLEEYAIHLGMSMHGRKTRPLRIIPVESAIEGRQGVATYNQVRELIKQQELIVVNPCICVETEEIKGNKCDMPRYRCFSFGDMAQYSLDSNGPGRQIDIDECLNLLDVAEEKALILRISNTQVAQWMCCCCPCCCPITRVMKMIDISAQLVISYYQAKIDPNRCNACGICLERCQIRAIKEGDMMEVKLEKCIGCGLCISACPEEAISFIPKENVEAPPKTMNDMFTQIKKERGLL